MFFYPLAVPRSTVYQKLGVDPEAPADEIRNAKTDFVNGLKRRKDVLDQKIEAILDQVEGLRKAYADQREFENKGREAETELAAATKRVNQLEKQALRLNADFTRMRKEAESLQSGIDEVNNLGLEKPENRQAYDQANPPLALLKLTAWPRTPSQTTRPPSRCCDGNSPSSSPRPAKRCSTPAT